MATTKLDHLDHLFMVFIYLNTPRFKYPKTEETIKEEAPYDRNSGPPGRRMKVGRQETVDSYMTSTFRRPLNLLGSDLSEKKIQHTKLYTKHRP